MGEVDTGEEVDGAEEEDLKKVEVEAVQRMAMTDHQSIDGDVWSRAARVPYSG